MRRLAPAGHGVTYIAFAKQLTANGLEARNRRPAMSDAALLFPKVTVGIDLGDKYSVVCEVDARGEVVARYQMRTTQVDLARHFGGRERCRVVIEAGTHSPWVSRELEAMNHEVVVANPA